MFLYSRSSPWSEDDTQAQKEEKKGKVVLSQKKVCPSLPGKQLIKKRPPPPAVRCRYMGNSKLACYLFLSILTCRIVVSKIRFWLTKVSASRLLGVIVTTVAPPPGAPPGPPGAPAGSTVCAMTQWRGKRKGPGGRSRHWWPLCWRAGSEPTWKKRAKNNSVKYHAYKSHKNKLCCVDVNFLPLDAQYFSRSYFRKPEGEATFCPFLESARP